MDTTKTVHSQPKSKQQKFDDWVLTFNRNDVKLQAYLQTVHLTLEELLKKNGEIK